MSEVSPLSSPLELLVEHRQPPYVFETDIIEAPSLADRLRSLRLLGSEIVQIENGTDVGSELTAQDKANLLAEALHSLPNEEAEWKQFNLEPTPGTPFNSFAVGTIFGACALDAELSAALAKELNVHVNTDPDSFFANNSRFAFIALQRIKGGKFNETLGQFEAMLQPYLPPIDTAMQARHLMYHTIDLVRGSKGRATSELLVKISSVSDILRSSNLNPQEQTALNTEIAGLIETCLVHVTADLKQHTVIAVGGSKKNEFYANLAASVGELHDSIGKTAFLPDTILRELDAMAACKAEEYTRPRTTGEAPHDPEMLAHAHTAIDAFLDSLAERRQAGEGLGKQALAAAQNIIWGSLKHISPHIDEIKGADETDRIVQALLFKAQAIFTPKEMSERQLNIAFHEWTDRGLSIRQRIARREAGKSIERLPESIHSMQFTIPEGSITYENNPEELVDHVMAYLTRRYGLKKVLTEPGMSIERVEQELRAWQADTLNGFPFCIEWSKNAPQGLIDPHTIVLMKKPEGKRQIVINRLEKGRLPIHQHEIEAFAMHAAGRFVDYDDLPQCSIVLRPTSQSLEAAKPDETIAISAFLDELAETYAFILDLPNAETLSYAHSFSNRFAFTAGNSSVNILTEDSGITRDGMTLIHRQMPAYSKNIKHLSLQLPKLLLKARNGNITPDAIRKMVEKARIFNTVATIKPAPGQWITEPTRLTRPYDPPTKV